MKKPPTGQQAQKSQRMEALAVANEVRCDRASIKRRIRAGKLDPVQYIENPPRSLEKVSVVEFLTWIPRMGQAKAHAMVRGVVYTRSLTLQSMSPRTRSEVASRLRACITRYEKFSSRRAAKLAPVENDPVLVA